MFVFRTKNTSSNYHVAHVFGLLFATCWFDPLPRLYEPNATVDLDPLKLAVTNTAHFISMRFRSILRVIFQQ